MHALDYTYRRWQSLLTELQVEREYVALACEYGEPPQYFVKRKALRGMDCSGCVDFYEDAVNAVTLYMAIDLFAVFEKYLFDDKIDRIQDSNKNFHTALVGNRLNTIEMLLHFWQQRFPQYAYKQSLFDTLDDARHYRNWIAHGRRFSCKAQVIPKAEEMYNAIVLFILWLEQI